MPSDSSRRVQADLETVHLPMLDAADFIDWNPETGEISKGERFEEIEPLLAYDI